MNEKKTRNRRWSCERTEQKMETVKKNKKKLKRTASYGRKRTGFLWPQFFFWRFSFVFFFNTNASARHLSPRSRKRKKFQNCWVGNSEDSKKTTTEKEKAERLPTSAGEEETKHNRRVSEFVDVR